MWLSWYLLPSKVIVEWENQLMMEFKITIQANYSIEAKSITSRNSRANTMLKNFQQAIGNIICTFKVQGMVLDDMNPWGGILAFTIFTLRLTVHTMTQHISAHLVFEQDLILNTRH